MMEGMELFDPISKPKILSSAAKLKKIPEDSKIKMKAINNKKRENSAEKSTQGIGE